MTTLTPMAGTLPSVGVQAKLYRCPTPTDRLCPCGRVARELRRQGVGFETERVPLRARGRAEIETLTGQRKVPLLLLGDEAIVDSKRIVEHLRWRAGA